LIYLLAKVILFNKKATFACGKDKKSDIIHQTSEISMFTVIGIMFAGIGIGYLLRQQSLPWIGKAITLLIWLLLFLLGIEVGHNEQIIRSLPTLGMEAFAIAIVCVLGSCLAAWGLWRYTHGRKEKAQ
jgi:uncharacterized membrane protein YbjE (DUF340 family)